MLKNSNKSVSLWNLSASYKIYALNRSRNNIFLIDLVYITRQQKYWIQWKCVLTYLQYRGRRCTWGLRPWGWSPSSSSYNASTDNILTSFSLDYAARWASFSQFCTYKTLLREQVTSTSKTSKYSVLLAIHNIGIANADEEETKDKGEKGDPPENVHLKLDVMILISNCPM